MYRSIDQQNVEKEYMEQFRRFVEEEDKKKGTHSIIFPI
jgi:hypothetical protein